MGPADMVPAIVAMGGSDCEMLRAGWLAQPVNVWSSVAYLVGAAYVLVRGSAVGAAALALVGFGSFLYHGPQPPWAEPAHDLAITALLVVILGLRSSRPVPAALVGAVALVATLLAPSPFVHGTLVALVAVAEVRRQRRRTRGPDEVLAAIALVAAGVLFLVGRTGGSLCAPDSPVQPHAGWHILTAVAAAVLLRSTAAARS